jgi:hypothetical protein
MTPFMTPHLFRHNPKATEKKVLNFVNKAARSDICPGPDNHATFDPAKS